MSYLKIIAKKKYIYAIGDIHGEYEQLLSLLKKIDFRTAQKLIFLGDYINRGPQSKQVVEYLQDFLKWSVPTIFLMGNHDYTLLNLLNRRLQSKDKEIFRRFDVEPTLNNYGLSTYSSIKKIQKTLINSNLYNFLETLKMSYETTQFFFSHAGVNPNMPINNQFPNDLLWDQDHMLEQKRLPFNKVFVFGHTVVLDPVSLHDRIAIDTGACYYNETDYIKGRLTAVKLDPENPMFREFISSDPPLANEGQRFQALIQNLPLLHGSAKIFTSLTKRFFLSS